MVGEIKKGKSSLVNAMPDVPSWCPPASTRHLDSVQDPVRSERKYRVHFVIKIAEDGAGKTAASTSCRGGKPLTVLSQQSGNTKGVISSRRLSASTSRKGCDHRSAGPGRTFVNLSIDHALLPKADCVLFVIDSTEHVLARTEIETLAKLRKHTERIALFNED